MAENFSSFKTGFYAKIKDFTLFDCAEFNALKIVLDALRVDYVRKGAVKSPIMDSLWKLKLIDVAKETRSKLKKEVRYSAQELAAFSQKKYVIADDGRFALDSKGEPHSYYFSVLMQQLKEENCVHVIEKVRHKKSVFDIDYNKLITTFLHQPLNKSETALIKDINVTFERIQKSGLFTEKDLQNIAFAFQNFFNKYKVWSRFLAYLNSSQFFCIVHYHNEGRTLAFRRKGIKVTELQHGLIAKTDVFYVFPKAVKTIVDKALFADEIWVYGAYWKNVLEHGVEYINKIEIVGYYLFDDFSGYESQEAELDALKKDKKAILITTQTTLHEPFVAYVKWLANDIATRNLNYCIFVKNHPLEKPEHYQELAQIKDVFIVNYALPILFKKVDLHVSIYSTTLYDGIRVGIPGFALHCEPYKDYIEEIVASGVAIHLQANQNPIDLQEQLKKASPEYYYSKFELEKVM